MLLQGSEFDNLASICHSDYMALKNVHALY